MVADRDAKPRRRLNRPRSIHHGWTGEHRHCALGQASFQKSATGDAGGAGQRRIHDGVEIKAGPLDRARTADRASEGPILKVPPAVPARRAAFWTFQVPRNRFGSLLVPSPILVESITFLPVLILVIRRLGYCPGGHLLQVVAMPLKVGARRPGQLGRCLHHRPPLQKEASFPCKSLQSLHSLHSLASLCRFC